MTISIKEYATYARLLENIRLEAKILRTAWPWELRKKNGALRRASSLIDILSRALAERVSKPRTKPEPTP